MVMMMVMVMVVMVAFSCVMHSVVGKQGSFTAVGPYGPYIVWQEYFDHEEQLYYYHDEKNDITLWELPKDDKTWREMYGKAPERNIIRLSPEREQANEENKKRKEKKEAAAMVGGGEFEEGSENKQIKNEGEEGIEEGQEGEEGGEGEEGDEEEEDILESKEDELSYDADENVLSDNHLHINVNLNGEMDETNKIDLENQLLQLATNGKDGKKTLNKEKVDELRKEGGLLDPKELLKLGLRVVERLDEVWVDNKMKSKDSSDINVCGPVHVPCNSIQLGIDRASAKSKVYVKGGYYHGKNNVNLRIDGRNIDLMSLPPQKAIIDCNGVNPLIDPLRSAGNTGIHDFQIVNCNIQDPNGQQLNGDIDSATIKLPDMKHTWDPLTKTFRPDPIQLDKIQKKQYRRRNYVPDSRRTKKKKRIQRNFFRL
jgi:hypothetical protein